LLGFGRVLRCLWNFSTFRLETYEEALVETLQFTAGFLVAQLTEMGFQKMTRCLQ
jgi:hypothetical protein